MSDQEITEAAETQLLSAEYKDGQLQIVEMRPFDKDDVTLDGEVGSSMPQLETDGQTKYVQLVNAGDKPMMQLDLLNLTLVRCEDGSESYRLLANGEQPDSAEATVTCVLASSDTERDEASGSEYVMVEGSQGPLVFLQSSLPGTEPALATVDPPQEQPEPVPVAVTTVISKKVVRTMSPAAILERAKALQKAKANMSKPATDPLAAGRRLYRGRKRKSDLPPPHELLAAPDFKLFLYSCKMCSFKCNAIKDMSVHKAEAHSAGGGGRWRAAGRAHVTLQCARCPYKGNSHSQDDIHVTLQCARCPYKGNSHSQLMKHVHDIHLPDMQKAEINKVYLDTEEVAAADVLVCGACGFESASRPDFRAHIEDEHGATTC